MSPRTRPAAGRRPTQKRRPPRKRPAWFWAGPAIAASALVLLAAVWVTGRDGDHGPASPAAFAEDPGVAHVHGLGVDPATGDLYVATHHGTFRVPDQGDAERVGESFQVTMGFTVVGERHFLGSGHPDTAGLRQGQPTRLGLIESTDAGETWQLVSLGGEADFHGLAYAHDRVYGWDASTGRFMVSADMRDWETRSTLDLYSFAVDPADAGHVIATTAAGTVASFDGGRHWAVSDGPPLVVLTWDPDSGLSGADAEGQVYRSTDDGDAWLGAGALPGTPQALLVTADTLYAAASDDDGTTGIYRSTDNGQSWTLRYRDRP